MRNAERFTIKAVIAGLRKSGAIDDTALEAIAVELAAAAELAGRYGSSEQIVIEQRVDDVRGLRAG